MKFDVLHNFISPVTGRILCTTDYVLVGDANGIAIPSLILPPGSLPNLPQGNIWIGDSSNRPIPNSIISISNLPNLGLAILPPVTSRGKIWRGTILNRPVESDDLSQLEIDVAVIETDITAINLVLTSLAASITALEIQVGIIDNKAEEAKTLAKYGPKPYGNIYLSGNLTLTPLLVNVFAKIEGTTTSSSLQDFTSPVSNQLKYTDSTTINALVTVNISAVLNVVEPDMILGISIYKNGSQILPVNYGHLVESNLPVSLSLSVYVQFATDDYVEAYISSNALGSVTVLEMSFSATTL